MDISVEKVARVIFFADTLCGARDELGAFIRSMTKGEIACLTALTWVGLGQLKATEIDRAAIMAEGNPTEKMLGHLLGNPLLATTLETAASAVDWDIPRPTETAFVH